MALDHDKVIDLAIERAKRAHPTYRGGPRKGVWPQATAIGLTLACVAAWAWVVAMKLGVL